MFQGRRISEEILTLLYLFGYLNAKIYFFVEGDVYSRATASNYGRGKDFTKVIL